jgi:hypothetical protein
MKIRGLMPSLLMVCLVGGNLTLQSSHASEPVIVAQTQWQKFSPPRSGFTVLMPKQPSEQVNSVDTVFGRITIHTFKVPLEQDRVNYTVSYVELPKEMVQVAPPEALLESLSNAFSQAFSREVKLLNQQSLRLGDYPGKEFKFEGPNQSIVRHRAYLVQQRMYQMTVETPQAEEETLSTEIENFFNSFQLLSSPTS